MQLKWTYKYKRGVGVKATGTNRQLQLGSITDEVWFKDISLWYKTFGQKLESFWSTLNPSEESGWKYNAAARYVKQKLIDYKNIKDIITLWDGSELKEDNFCTSILNQLFIEWNYTNMYFESYTNMSKLRSTWMTKSPVILFDT